jgi:hypothetical protein
LNISDRQNTEVDLIVASQANWKGLLLQELRTIILASSSEISEAVKWKMPSKPLGSPTWEVAGILCVADYLKNAVRITFPKGAQLNDTAGLFNARMDSKTARAIDFPESSNVNSRELQALVKQAIFINTVGK